MLTAFLIVTLIFFSLSLMLSILVIGVAAATENVQFPIVQGINVLVLLAMITWNIIVLASL